MFSLKRKPLTTSNLSEMQAGLKQEEMYERCNERDRQTAHTYTLWGQEVYITNSSNVVVGHHHTLIKYIGLDSKRKIG